MCSPLGSVNLTVSSQAESAHDLCDNKIAVTPVRGDTDTVIKSLLVKDSLGSEGNRRPWLDPLGSKREKGWRAGGGKQGAD